MTTSESAKVQELQERYNRAAHAMQTGVAYEQQKAPKSTEPKHLRVGVNSALIQIAGLALLLMHKGLITEVEYWEAMATGMEEEVRIYEERLHALYGGGPTKITLL